jgi:hypothetical protein
MILIHHFGAKSGIERVTPWPDLRPSATAAGPADVYVEIWDDAPGTRYPDHINAMPQYGALRG